ncbi:electron transfer flavoprotein subunit beta [Thiohalorhabdus methylotrophus]|uniref:Electron transfer flavoprotein subunit beta n=1 Tax=Thiohalorhabdus methylotrophus TaxID=3242694 RepID=A0ABV4TVG3_9GAMM
MHPEIAVLVSAGRHPASGRPRRAPGDARAVELALRLTPRPLVLHAGDPEEPALRDYLGMGVETLTVLECPDESDPIPCLAATLEGHRPELILTAQRTEHGPATGYLPYAVARALGAALAPAILDITPGEPDGFYLAQALPGGRRRSLRARSPVVATVDRAAPAPRPSAFGPARRGTIHVQRPDVPPPTADRPEAHPARRRPKRLRAAEGTAAERQAALRGGGGGNGRTLETPSPPEAARAIHAFLLDAGVLRAAPDGAREEAARRDRAAP